MVNGESWRVYDTPLGRISVYTHPCVYEPSEDSLLAVKAISYSRKYLQRVNRVLDIGTGTGILAKAMAKAYPNAYAVATDVNPYALQSARRTLEELDAVVIACKWATCLRDRFDLVTLNPPYLPVHDELPKCRELGLAWSGSPDLLEEACRDAARVSQALIIVYSSLSLWKPDNCLRENDLRIVFMLEESFFMEKLYAVLAVRGMG